MLVMLEVDKKNDDWCRKSSRPATCGWIYRTLDPNTILFCFLLASLSILTDDDISLCKLCEMVSCRYLCCLSAREKDSK